MTSTPSNPAADRSLRLQSACTLLVAVGAAYVSYRHGRAFALRHGADDTTATLWPLIVDGLVTMATIELWKTSRHRTTGQWKAWLAFTLGIALSLSGNIASAPELNAPAIAVSACPPLALLLSVELLNQALKRHRADTPTRTDRETGDDGRAAPNSAEPEETSSSTETPPAPGKMPALRTVVNNAPGHSDSIRVTLNNSSEEQSDPLIVEAYRLDDQHWDQHQRPISAETLRRELRIGSHRARVLVHSIRRHRQPASTEVSE